MARKIQEAVEIMIGFGDGTPVTALKIKWSVDLGNYLGQNLI